MWRSSRPTARMIGNTRPHPLTVAKGRLAIRAIGNLKTKVGAFWHKLEISRLPLYRHVDSSGALRQDREKRLGRNRPPRSPLQSRQRLTVCANNQYRAPRGTGLLCPNTPHLHRNREQPNGNASRQFIASRRTQTSWRQLLAENEGKLSLWDSVSRENMMPCSFLAVRDIKM